MQFYLLLATSAAFSGDKKGKMATGSLPMPISGDLSPDFVFSHSELEDVLAFMTGGVEEKPSSFSTNNFLLGSTPPASASLQFQPHLSNPYDGLGLDQGLNGAQPFISQMGNDVMLSGDASMPFDLADEMQPELNPQPGSKGLRSGEPMIKSEPASDMDAAAMRSPLTMSAAPSPVHASSEGMDDASGRPSSMRTRNAGQAGNTSDDAPLTKAFSQLGSGLSSPPSRPRHNSAELHPAYHRKGELVCDATLITHPCQCLLSSHPWRECDQQDELSNAGSKQHTSHSTVEKNRRDRINSLIDEVCLLLQVRSV